MNNKFFYRISQVIGFLLGARFFVALLLTFALYVSTFFLFNKEESLRNFVFDFRVHGIIFCTVLSILAGGIINQFYDREKDEVTKPLRTRIQNFLKQRYFLYAYIGLNTISLTIAVLLSPRVFFFFLVYQFIIWFYSHKLSKMLIINNLSFVTLTLYPFFGMLVYYKTLSLVVFLMALFLFLFLLIIDVTKDILTKNADKIFGYATIASIWGTKSSQVIILATSILLMMVSVFIVSADGLHGILNLYFVLGLLVFTSVVILMYSKRNKRYFFALNILRLWLFLGIISMLLDGILERF